MRKYLLFLIFLITGLITINAALGAVYINEVLPNPDGDEPENEWIELYSDTGEDLEGWTISDGEGEYTFGDVSIDEEGYIVLIYDDNGEELAENYIVYGAADNPMILANADDDLTLYDSDDNEIDFVSWGDDDDVDVPSPNEEESVARIHDGNDEIILVEDYTQGEENNRVVEFVGEDELEVDEDEILELDIEDFFEDADGDVLSFSAEGSENILVNINEDGTGFEIVPDENFFGEETIEINVDDGYVTVFQEIDIVVNSDNDVPIIVSEHDERAVESQTYEYELEVEDVDNEQEDLFIDLDLSTIDGIALNVLNDENINLEIDDLIFEVTFEEAGEVEISLVVSDGDDNSESQEFSLNVLKANEILVDTIEIVVDGERFDLNDEINVNPGSEVNVEYYFVNNLDGMILGNLDVFANSNQDPDFVNYEGSGFAILPQRPNLDFFNFDVPLVQAEDFEVTIEIIDENVWGDVFGDEVTIDFVLERELQSIEIVEATLSDNTLTCVSNVDIELVMVNTGFNDVSPHVFVFDHAVELDSETGEFDSDPDFELIYDEDFVFEPGVEDTLSIEIDTIDLEGPTTLFVYVTSPFFWDAENGFRFGAQKTFDIVSVGDCLNYQEIAQEMTTFKNSGEELEIDLFEFVDGEYVYINEDLNYENQIEFSIDDQSFSELVDCEFIDDNGDVGEGHILVCSEPAQNEIGENDLTILVEDNFFNTIFLEQAQVRVLSTLEFSDVELNEVLRDEITLEPLENLEVKFRLENDLDEAINAIEIELIDNDLNDGFDFDIDEQINLNIGAGAQSNLQTIEFKMPHNINDGVYSLALVAQGRDSLGEEVDAIFEISIEIEKQNNKVLLDAQLVGEDSLTCQESAFVELDLNNVGNLDINDLFIKVSDNDREIYSTFDEGFIELDSSELLERRIIIPLEASGVHSVVTKVSYNFANPNDINNRGSAANIITSDAIVITKNNCLAGFEPDVDEISLRSQEEKTFRVNLNEEDFEGAVTWLLDGQEVLQDSLTYTFVAQDGGEFELVANINDNEERLWRILVTDRPISRDFTTNIPQEGNVDLAEFRFLEIENQFAKIIFSEAVDLREILNLDEVVIIEDGLVAIDSANAPGLANRGARIVLKDFNPDNSFVYKYDGFSANVGALGERSDCDTCELVENDDGDYEFVIEAFSTYVIVSEEEVDLRIPSSIEFEDVSKDSTQETTFTLTNLGTVDSITGIVIDTSDIAAKYNVVITGLEGVILAEDSDSVTITIDVPSDEDSSEHEIGNMVISSNELNDVAIPVSVSTINFIEIKNVEINGDDDGELSIEDLNEFVVEVENNYNQDMDEVSVTVTIENVDNDDLDEESDEDNIDQGNSEEFSVDIDLAGEEIDDDSYVVTIEVKAEAEDGTIHRASKSITVDLDLEKHDVIISRESLSSSTLSCDAFATLEVEVRNVGTSNEDEVEVRVSNDKLNLNLAKDNVELDKFSRNDNEDEVKFNLNLEDAAAGDYMLNVEVFVDGDKTDSSIVNVKKVDCQRSGQIGVNTLGAKEDTLKVLQDALANERVIVGSEDIVTSKVTFRDSDNYVMLLGIMVFLAIVAVILFGAMLIFKRD